jgi:predicted Zn-dependent protease
MTVEDEIKISREFRREAKKHLELVSNPEVNSYIDKVARRILSVMGPQPFEYRFLVVKNSQLNAFAVPGGSIYVHTGLIERVGSTDELAGVLGHEIIHVKGRHMARLSEPDPISLLGLLGIFLAAGGGQAQAVGMLGQGLAATRQLSYNRKVEREADTLGVKYMAEAGYDPNGAVRFLKIMDQERILNPVDIPPYMLSHPLTHERIGSVSLVVRSLGPQPPRTKHPDPINRVQLILHLKNEEVDGVIEKLKKMVSQNPEKADPKHLLGMAYHYKGKWAPARENYEKARALDANIPGIDRDLGRLFTQTGEFRLAHEAFKRSLIAESKEPLNYLYLGTLFEEESQFGEAVSAYLRAVNLSPLWAEPARHLGKVYGKMYRMGDAYYYLGRAHLLEDEDEKAIAFLQRALEIFGQDSPRGEVISDEIEVIRAML